MSLLLSSYAGLYLSRGPSIGLEQRGLSQTVEFVVRGDAVESVAYTPDDNRVTPLFAPQFRNACKTKPLPLVLVAGVAAGFVGYAVGASSLVSYPALLAFGILPVLSNTTNTVGVCGTGIGGLLSARKELTGQGGRVAVYACIGLVGGVIGGLLLLELPAKVFEFAVPPLILFSALIIAFNPRRKAAARDAVAWALPQSYQAERAARIADATTNGALCDDPWWLWVGVSFVGVYSGYFGAAAGTLALAILDLGKIGPFHQINALKTVVGFGANIPAAVMFVIRGSVCWPFAIMMCIGCTIGSAIAPPITRRIPENVM